MCSIIWLLPEFVVGLLCVVHLANAETVNLCGLHHLAASELVLPPPLVSNVSMLLPRVLPCRCWWRLGRTSGIVACFTHILAQEVYLVCKRDGPSCKPV